MYMATHKMQYVCVPDLSKLASVLALRLIRPQQPQSSQPITQKLGGPVKPPQSRCPTGQMQTRSTNHRDR